MNVLLKSPGKPATSQFLPHDDLHLYQQMVGGPIETVFLPRTQIVMIVNEEGKLRGLQPNLPLYVCGELVDILVGNIIFCRLKSEGFDSLRQSDIEILKERFPQLWQS